MSAEKSQMFFCGGRKIFTNGEKPLTNKPNYGLMTTTLIDKDFEGKRIFPTDASESRRSVQVGADRENVLVPELAL